MNQPATADGNKQRIQEALAHHQAGRLDEASAIYQDLLEANPDDFNALQLMGLIHAAKNQPDKASDCMERSLALNPNQPAVHNNLATLRFRQGNYSEAIAHFASAIQQKPDYLQPA
ncbi:MAG: tetratricopeptide repeat protein, partial [Rickettsiales bacterium]